VSYLEAGQTVGVPTGLMLDKLRLVRRQANGKADVAISCKDVESGEIEIR
jgi:hypothetical protein